MEGLHQKNLADISKFGQQLINKASYILRQCNFPVSSFPKEEFDLVTDIDIRLEKFLTSEIKKHFPNHDLIAEESMIAGFKPSSDFCWVVDPLDGTVNLAVNIPFFCISVALLYRMEPILAWVYDPLRQELFYAQKDLGAFLNGQKLLIQNNPLMLPIGGTSGFLEQIIVNSSNSALTTFIRQFGKIRILGSQALHLAYIAAGRLKATISWEAKIWDDAAGALIVQEAGALYSSFQGKDIFPIDSNSLILSGQSIHSLAATPILHQEIVEFMTQWIKDELNYTNPETSKN